MQCSVSAWAAKRIPVIRNQRNKSSTWHHSTRGRGCIRCRMQRRNSECGIAGSVLCDGLPLRQGDFRMMPRFSEARDINTAATAIPASTAKIATPNDFRLIRPPIRIRFRRARVTRHVVPMLATPRVRDRGTPRIEKDISAKHHSSRAGEAHARRCCIQPDARNRCSSVHDLRCGLGASRRARSAVGCMFCAGRGGVAARCG